MRITFCGLAAPILAFASLPAQAQTVESTFSLTLTAQVTVPMANGSRILSLRLGTRDLVESIKDDLGISATGGTLVMRRAIGDFDTPGETWLIVGGQQYLVDEPISEIDVQLPDSFFAEVEAVNRRPSDGVETSVTRVSTDALAGGDLAQDGFEMTLVGIGTSSLRLLSQKGVDIGHVLNRFSANLMGGILIDVPGVGTVPGVITGTLRRGSEKIVAQ